MVVISLVHDIKEAEALWREISPNKTIFDDWDFRYAFYKYEPCPLHFYVAKEDGKLVGLLPLQFNKDWDGLEFFAEEPCEENRAFIKDGREDIIPKLYSAIKGRAKFYDISGEDKFTCALPLEDYKYILPLDGLKDFNDFLATRLSTKRRHSLAKEILSVDNLKPKYAVNEWADFEKLIILNVNSFAKESYLKTKDDQAPWRELIKKTFNWRLISIQIAGETQAVSLSVNYQGNWHYLLTGVNFQSFPGLGKYLTKVNIEEAIKDGAKYFDAGLGDCGWKDLWHFDRLSQYEFINCQ